LVIYVWADGSWIYDWETTSFLIQHKATLQGGRWINLDKLYMTSDLSDLERDSVVEALGGE
jgi:hypothetical protein